MAKLKSINPATGDCVREYPEMSFDEASGAIQAADRAFGVWRRTEFSARAACLKNAAGLLRRNQADYARLMAIEMGKPVAQGRAEVEKCAWVCDFYAEHGASFLAPELVPTDAAKSYVAFPPLGVVLAIMPWNFPFWQVFRFAAPAVMAGSWRLARRRSSRPMASTRI